MKTNNHFLKKFFSSCHKAILYVLLICIGATSLKINYIIQSFAGELGQELTLVGGTANGNYVEYFQEATLMGKIQVRIGENVLTPVGNKIVLPTYVEPYQVGFYFTLEPGYEINNYTVGESTFLAPGGGANPFISITSGDDISVSFNFQSINNNPGPGDGEILPPPGSGDGEIPGPGQDNGPLPSMENYPILAYFEGVTEPVLSNVVNNTITIPSGWTNGAISFKANICNINGTISPDYGVETVCSGGEKSVTDLEIEAYLSFGGSGDDYVSGSPDDRTLNISSGFFEVGKVGVHFVTDILNTIVNIISEDLISVSASSPMRMSYSYGSITTDQAMVTNSDNGNISIFFGNNETTLFASGPKVVGITNLSGATHVLNAEDKSVVVALPPLSQESVTPVSIEIELENGTKVTKKINIIRTAIELAYEGESRTINAGYVMHKSYLYNNQPHNDEIFNAYLQVILYRDNVVAGYKQVKIDDEEFINNSPDDEGAIEAVGPDRILLFSLGEIVGVNRASVFLTNGPIDFNSNILPSIEFGLGSGVEIEWEEN